MEDVDSASEMAVAFAPEHRLARSPKRPTQIRRRVFRDEIREQVIDEILSGRLAPGARIVETRLAQQFGVSQAPVREALRDLALFGFVVCSPFRGTYVRQVSTDDLVESYPVRAALESLAAREAATRIDDETLAALEAHIAAMRKAAEVNDHRAHVDADFAFHQTVIKAAGNHMLQDVWQSMRLATTTLVTHSMTQMTHRSMFEIGERHVTVLEALRSRDPARAEHAMRRHIEEPGDWIREAVRKEKESAQEHQPEAEEASADPGVKKR
jgi:DNA-binding GntR family transcriptional regulator